MANYQSKTLSSYFKVKSEKKLRELLQHTMCTDEDLSLDVCNGEYCIYGNTSIVGYLDDEEANEEANFDKFGKKLQDLLLDGESVIIYEIGSEKFRYRYIVADSILITKNKIEYISLTRLSEEKIRELKKDK